MSNRSIPEGYQLVPVSPTVEMLLAAEYCEEGDNKDPSSWKRNEYKAMLEASPKVIIGDVIEQKDLKDACILICELIGVMPDFLEEEHEELIKKTYVFLEKMYKNLEIVPNT